jgi:hypothetical protein
VTDPVSRYEQLLPDEQQDVVRAECGKLYEQVLPLADGTVEAGDRSPRSDASERRASAKKS